MTSEHVPVEHVEALPCPFCGGGAVPPQFDDEFEAWRCGCSACNASTWADTEVEALTAWNTRLAHTDAAPMGSWRTPAQAGDRLLEMIPMPVELVVTDADRQAACILIGNDTYGKPVWTVDTIPESNRVVMAFAKHRIASAIPADAAPAASGDASGEGREQPLCQNVPDRIWLMDLGGGDIEWSAERNPAEAYGDPPPPAVEYMRVEARTGPSSVPADVDRSPEGGDAKRLRSRERGSRQRMRPYSCPRRKPMSSPTEAEMIELGVLTLLQACREYPAEAKVGFGWGQAEFLARAIHTLYSERIEQVRREALEEAARVADRHSHWALPKDSRAPSGFNILNRGRNSNARFIATAIRSLQESKR